MRVRDLLFLTAALAIAGAVPAIAAEDPRGPLYAGAVAPMNQTIETRLLPRMAVLADKLLAEKRDMTLDGVKVFEADDKFLPGKIAVGLAYLIIDTPRNDPRSAKYLAAYRQIADMTVDDPNENGICAILFDVLPNGSTQNPEVICNHRDLKEPALSAVRGFALPMRARSGQRVRANNRSIMIRLTSD